MLIGALFSVLLPLGEANWQAIEVPTQYTEVGGVGCHRCHGLYADGAQWAGGDIRGASLDAFEHALASEPTMMPLTAVLSEQDRVELVAYLAQFNGKSLVKLRLDQHEALDNWIAPTPPYQLLIENRGLTSQSFRLSAQGEVIEVAPLSSWSAWITPP